MTINALHESLKAFLAGHNFISEAEAALPGFPLVVENAYKSFALNKLGLIPQLVPANVHQVDPRILNDALWSYTEDGDGPVTNKPPARITETQVSAPAPQENTEAPAPAAEGGMAEEDEEEKGDDHSKDGTGHESEAGQPEDKGDKPPTDMVFEVSTPPAASKTLAKGK